VVFSLAAMLTEGIDQQRTLEEQNR